MGILDPAVGDLSSPFFNQSDDEFQRLIGQNAQTADKVLIKPWVEERCVDFWVLRQKFKFGLFLRLMT